MSEPVDHHFIPIFYLKRWAGADGKVAVYSRKGGRVIVSRLSPRSTGFERGLYTLDRVEPATRQAVETEFFNKQIDDRAAVALESVMTRGSRELTEVNRVVLSHFLMSLRARHPDSVKRAREEGAAELRRHLELSPEEYERVRQSDDPPTLAAAAERFMPARVANFGINALQAVICHPRVGERLFAGKWSTVDFTFTQKPTSLLTSDRPCLLEGNLMADGPFRLMLVVSTTKLLSVCDGEPTERMMRALPSDTLLHRINRAIVLQAAKYVYGVDDSHLSDVEELLVRPAA
ncbi:MAG: DUF4238 domain-containing protein [Proteobacteria bacterium]|nr:DUF4238 domain-containing protein [Pseudomonadota bacterium]